MMIVVITMVLPTRDPMDLIKTTAIASEVLTTVAPLDLLVRFMCNFNIFFTK